jgi:two-component system, OmpR family, alkaline phosphatase synthesis response regulator PhoP
VSRVLVVEDDRNVVEVIDLHLRDIGLTVEHASCGADAMQKLRLNEYLLIILDRVLPDSDGLDVCRFARQVSETTPIVMLTAKSQEVDKVLGLELGADDYITKPFSVHELAARIKAILRRCRTTAVTSTDEVLTRGAIVINKTLRTVTVEGEGIELTAREFDLLLFLASHPGRPFSRAALLSAVWAYEFNGYEHTVNSHINRLRKKIEKDLDSPTYILTVWGVGYRFAREHEYQSLR